MGGNTIRPQRIPCRSNGVINSVHWLLPALLPLKWTTRPSSPPRLTLRPTLRFSSPPGHLRDASSRLRLCRHALCPLTTLTPIDIHICLNLPTGRKRCTIKSVSHEVPGKEIAGHLPFLALPSPFFLIRAAPGPLPCTCSLPNCHTAPSNGQTSAPSASDLSAGFTPVESPSSKTFSPGLREVSFF